MSLGVGEHERFVNKTVSFDPSRVPEEGACNSVGIGFKRVRSEVTVTFNSRPDFFRPTLTEPPPIPSLQDEHREKSSPSSPPRASSRLSKEVKAGDVSVHRYRCFYSAFTRSYDGSIDQEMERQFSAQKYRHFRGALIQWSFLMPLGVLGLAVNAGLKEHFARFAVLMGGVAPLYIGYGIFALRSCRYPTSPTAGKMASTRVELWLIGLLCLQSTLIVVAEWVRPQADYGLLAMHIGFVHNFTPLSAGHMQVVTAAFGLLPYTLLRIWKVANSLEMFPEEESLSGSKCRAPNEDEGLTLGILTPLIIFIYQCVVTMRRDESLRIDSLTGDILQRQERLLDEEEKKNQGMLSTMLPLQLIDALKANEHVEPQFYYDVTVIFVEICNFHKLCAHLLPTTVVEVLNIVYHEFDRLSDLLSVYKVETVGQVYMAVVGAPEPILNHADVAAHFALAAQESVQQMKQYLDSIVKAPMRSACSMSSANSNHSPKSLRVAALAEDAQASPAQARLLQLPGENHPGLSAVDVTPGDFRRPTAILDSELTVLVRVGLNSGQLRAGVVGIDSPRFKLFGDTVNTASRMESTCEPGKVQASPSTLARLSQGMFKLEDRGEIPVKGKGKMRTSFLLGYTGDKPSSNERRIVIERMDKATGSGEEIMRSQSEAFVGRRRSSSRPSTKTNGSGGSGGRQTVHSVAATSSPSAKRGGGTPTERLAGAVKGPPKEANPLAFVREALAREESGDPSTGLNSSWGSESHGRMAVLENIRGCIERIQTILLLVPQDEKESWWMLELKHDRPVYQKENLPKQLESAKTLTLILLFVRALLTCLDFYLEPYEEAENYGATILLRALGGSIVGLGYLLALTSPGLSRRFAQDLTMLMLVCQGATQLLCVHYMYESEPLLIGMVAMYGAYTLFYTVITILQRLLLFCIVIISYVVGYLFFCGPDAFVGAAQNIAFLIVFEICMASGVQLQEHLMHVSHYEQRQAQQRLIRTKQAKSAGSTLLSNLLPQHVIPLVRDGISPIAEHHADVTIIFTDIKGFTDYSSRVSPSKLFTVLNSMYSAFDEIISNWALHKVEIIGDAYFISAGCPTQQPHSRASRRDQDRVEPSEWAMRAVEVALALLRTLPSVCDDSAVQMRVGLHTGPVVAGVVGKKGPRYHLFGAAVGYAEQMESSGIPGRVQISDATHQMLEGGGHAYDFEERSIEVEGEEGLQRTWLVKKSNSKEAMAIQKKLMVQRRFWQQSERSQQWLSEASAGEDPD